MGLWSLAAASAAAQGILAVAGLTGPAPVGLWSLVAAGALVEVGFGVGWSLVVAGSEGISNRRVGGLVAGWSLGGADSVGRSSGTEGSGETGCPAAVAAHLRRPRRPRPLGHFRGLRVQGLGLRV